MMQWCPSLSVGPDSFVPIYYYIIIIIDQIYIVFVIHTAIHVCEENPLRDLKSDKKRYIY